MAVESSHLCSLFPAYFPSPPPPDLFCDLSNQLGLCDAAATMGFAPPVSSSGAGCLMQFCAPAPAPAAASDSGLTYNDATATAAAAQQPRKRQRVLIGGIRDPAPAVSFLGEDLSPYMLQQQAEIDRLIAIHVGRMRSEMMERGKRASRRLLAAAELVVARRLREKEEEAERISNLNSALEERVRCLFAENMVWRDLARSSEAAVNLLRCNLETVLAGAGQFRAAGEKDLAADDDEDAVESCCGDSDEERKAAAAATRHLCRCCGSREAAVLILPCRHLSLCAACSPATVACPVCKCYKEGSVVVRSSPYSLQSRDDRKKEKRKN